MLPPTRAALMPHIARANYTAVRDKSYITSCPVLPPIDQSGWNLENGVYVLVRCLVPPAPRAVLELTKCGCRLGVQESAAGPDLAGGRPGAQPNYGQWWIYK